MKTGRPPNRKTIEEFMENVEKSKSCWLWIGTISESGYGVWRINSKYYRAHRIAYELFVGEIPDGIFVCHTCDIRNCVNPDHLFLGTTQDNTQDKVNKSRQNSVTGEDHGNAKLTEKQVEEIRQLYEEKKWTQQKIADRFNVSQINISAIINRKLWKHI